MCSPGFCTCRPAQSQVHIGSLCAGVFAPYRPNACVETIHTSCFKQACLHCLVASAPALAKHQDTSTLCSIHPRLNQRLTQALTSKVNEDGIRTRQENAVSLFIWCTPFGPPTCPSCEAVSICGHRAYLHGEDTHAMLH